MSKKSRSVNYARSKAHWGAMPGTIQIHTVEGLGSSNDPTTAIFKELFLVDFCVVMVRFYLQKIIHFLQYSWHW